MLRGAAFINFRHVQKIIQIEITIIGTGYVGLVTGACLAELGNDVFRLDLDQKKIDLLNDRGIPIHEPGLADIVQRNLRSGRLVFSTDILASVAHGGVQFIAVGTPPDEDGAANLQYVLAAAREIGRHMRGFKVIVDKSKVPVGTAEKSAPRSPLNWLGGRTQSMRVFRWSRIRNFCKKARRSRTSCGPTG